MESKSYWNRELLPLLLNNEKVFFHEILKLISERYIKNISLLADFIDGFLLCDDNFLSVDKYNRLGDFICSLKSLEFQNFRDTVHNNRKTKNYVPFIFELHVVKSNYETVVTTYWDSNYLKESFLADDEIILKFEKSFIFLDSSITQKKPLFYLNDSFSLIEASCLISGDNPIQITRCFNDTNFDQNYPSFNEVYNFLNSAISSGNLSEQIEAQELKTYLHRKGKFIDGFNDHLKNLEASQNSNIQGNTIDQLEKENEKLRAELLDKELKIKELEADRISEQSAPISANDLIGLARINQLAKDRQGMARVIALSLWNEDKNILIGDMADKVYKAMIPYCREELPQLPETLKGWIRPIATDEAQKKGRPKSNN